MAIVTWHPVLRPAEDALVYQLHATALPSDVAVSLKFSYTSPTMRFDHAEFYGLMGKVEHSYENGKGTVKITADLWPNSSNFISFVFTGAEHGSLHINSASIALNGQPADTFGPPPFIIGTPTLEDFKVNPLPESLAQEIPQEVLDFIASIYVGAFQRPAEFEGLAYWSQALLNYIDQGYDAEGALKGLTRDIHWAGTQNNEPGTELSTEDYIDFVYRNVLGREAEPGGKEYWVEYIEKNGRSEFLNHFLYSALSPGNSDGDYVRARVAVSNYYSQETYSGPAAIDAGVTQGLGDVLGGVKDQATAIDAIQGMIAKRFGEAESSSSAVLSLDGLPEDVLMVAGLEDVSDPLVYDEPEIYGESEIDVELQGLPQLSVDTDPLA